MCQCSNSFQYRELGICMCVQISSHLSVGLEPTIYFENKDLHGLFQESI